MFPTQRLNGWGAPDTLGSRCICDLAPCASQTPTVTKCQSKITVGNIYHGPSYKRKHHG
jgi:hypothetical protein